MSKPKEWTKKMEEELGSVGDLSSLDIDYFIQEQIDEAVENSKKQKESKV